MSIVVTLYDEIREGDAARVLQTLRADPGADVEVRLNSPGGLVSEGLAIFNALKPRKPIVYIDGIVASIASLIAMAGRRIIAAENSLLMIHNPWVTTTGAPADLRRTAEVLDKHLDAMVSAYGRTGLSDQDLRRLLDAETWMTANEAFDLGFVDEVGEALRYAAHSPLAYAAYLNTPEHLMPKPATAPKNLDQVAPDPNKPDVPDPNIPDDARTLEAFKKGLSSDAVIKSAHDAVMKELQQRNDLIMQCAGDLLHTNSNVRALVMNSLRDPSMTFERFGAKFLALVGRDAEPLAGAYHVDTSREAFHSGYRASGGAPAGDDFVQAASDALAMQVGIRVAKPHAGARDVAGMGLQGIVRACVNRSGQASQLGFGASGAALVQAALTTSDFPKILESTLGKALRHGYENEPATYEAWTTKVLVPDFKEQSRVILGSAPGLLPVLEGGEYTLGALDEDKSVPYSVTKFGRMVRFTWEALVNDDLGAFARMIQGLGQAAARAEGDQVYDAFTANSGAGPTMQDSKALFHNDHANLATSSTSLDAAALGKARILLRRQTAIGGGILNLSPRFLLVSPEHEQAAESLLAASARSLSQGSNNELVPAWLAKLELVVEARLSDDAFYLLASPDQVDTLERAWLEVDNGPVIAEEDSFGVDAHTYKVRHVFASRWLDWRGAVMGPISGT